MLATRFYKLYITLHINNKVSKLFIHIKIMFTGILFTFCGYTIDIYGLDPFTSTESASRSSRSLESVFVAISIMPQALSIELVLNIQYSFIRLWFHKLEGKLL